MAAYRRVGSRHLQTDCQEPGSAPEPCARQSSTGYLYILLTAQEAYQWSQMDRATRIEQYTELELDAQQTEQARRSLQVVSTFDGQRSLLFRTISVQLSPAKLTTLCYDRRAVAKFSAFRVRNNVPRGSTVTTV